MNYKYIDFDNWNRKEYFQYYYKNIPCTYSMTTKLDISKIKEYNLKLYPTMLYSITNIVNRYDEFKTSLDSSEKLIIFDKMIPSYTIFNKETETFSNLWTDYDEDYYKFFKNYNKDMDKFKNQYGMNLKKNTPVNTFPISMIPWASFEGFNLNLKEGYNYLLPIFTMGKYFKENDKYLLPLSIQVHHAVCDGFHICRFINELQNLLYNNFNNIKNI